MGDLPTKPSHTARNTVIGVAVALLLYVLSIGPVVKLGMQWKIPERAGPAITVFYAPLGWLAGHDKKLTGPLLDWYVGWWIK